MQSISVVFSTLHCEGYIADLRYRWLITSGSANFIRHFEKHEAWRTVNRKTMGAFHSTKNSGNSGMESEWNSHFPEFHSEILGVPREVGLKFRKIGITGKFRSIRPFLLGPSFSEPGNRIQHG